jgi:hypothetical protein
MPLVSNTSIFILGDSPVSQIRLGNSIVWEPTDSKYFEDMSAQMYSWEELVFIPWWGN